MATVQGDIMVGSVKNMVNRLSKDFSTSKPPLSIHEPRKPLFSKTSSSGLLQVVVTFTYKATQDDELSLSVGDIIEVLEEIEDGWSKGKNMKTGEVGVFPTNFVENRASTTPTNTIPTLREERQTAEPEVVKRTPSVIGVALPSMAIPPSTTTTTFPVKKEADDGPKTKEMARVKFVYEPQHPDELKLGEIGALIEIVRKDCGDPGWFEGEIHGKVGLFPDNFVELVQVPIGCTSGSPKAVKQETRMTAKAPILAPSGSVAVPPAVPAKPKPKLTDSNSSLNTIPTATAPQLPSSAKPAVSSNFTDIRNRLQAGLKVVAPGDPSLSKSTIISGSNSDTDPVCRPMSTVEMGTAEVEQPAQLSHATKDRPRAPGKRPMSMLVTKKKGSTDNLLENSTTNLPGSSAFSAYGSMSTSAQNIPSAVSVSEAPLTAPVSSSPSRFSMKPLKEEAREEPKSSYSFTSTVSDRGDGGMKVRAQAFHANSSANSVPTKVSPVPSVSGESDTVSRKEFNDLLARFNLLEARLASLENAS